VIAGHQCATNPGLVPACDHLEETVVPAETLGRRYVVTVPTGPGGNAVGHTVSLYGNVDGTALTFDPPISGAPTRLDAGQVVDLGVLDQDFEVAGDSEFAVASFQLGGNLVDPSIFRGSRGDPSQSLAVPVEQYRSKYVFLAPDDYDESFVDVVLPLGATVRIDDAIVVQQFDAIGSTQFGVLRVPLGQGQGGAHVLEADRPVGVQVMGYGAYTSYQYPGGLNLEAIAPPPIK
jgi:hypothetical protein